MAATGVVNIIGNVKDLPTGSKVIGPLAITADAAVASEVQVELASGANTIDVPTGATIAIISFDPASTTDKTLKGVTGDTGITVADTGLAVFCPTGSSFCITSSAADTDCTTTVLFV